MGHDLSPFHAVSPTISKGEPTAPLPLSTVPRTVLHLFLLRYFVAFEALCQISRESSAQSLSHCLIYRGLSLHHIDLSLALRLPYLANHPDTWRNLIQHFISHAPNANCPPQTYMSESQRSFSPSSRPSELFPHLVRHLVVAGREIAI
jgi:hypothetical protein